jgi:sugar phosphate isomerase/epimerase
MLELNIRFAAMSLMWGAANLQEHQITAWLNDVQAAGYDGIACFDAELLRFLANSEFRNQLTEHGLSLASVDYILEKDIDRFKHVCELMQSLGCQQLVAAGGMARRGAAMNEIADLLKQLGEISLSYGIFTSYHHHTGHLAETFAETEALLSLTNPNVFFGFVDIGHATKDFEDLAPIEHRAQHALERLADRLCFIEFKDWSPDTDLATEVGAGKTDWDAVFNWLRQHAYSGWITVEQNAPSPGRSAFESARNSRLYIKEHFM